jgi:hypothetical protein
LDVLRCVICRRHVRSNISTAELTHQSSQRGNIQRIDEVSNRTAVFVHADSVEPRHRFPEVIFRGERWDLRHLDAFALRIDPDLARYMDSPCVANSGASSGFRIGLRTIYPASRGVRRRRALMTFARRGLVSFPVSGPPFGLSGSFCDGLTCFHQQLRSSNPGGFVPPRSQARVTGCPAYVRPRRPPAPQADILRHGRVSPRRYVRVLPRGLRPLHSDAVQHALQTMCRRPGRSLRAPSPVMASSAGFAALDAAMPEGDSAVRKVPVLNHKLFSQ